MRKLSPLFLAILTASLVPCTWAQNPTSVERREIAQENDAKEVELVTLEKETVHALQLNDTGLFRRLYGEDFAGILPSGQVLDKAGWIASIQNSRIEYSSFVASDIRVRLFEETAVVTCLWTSRGTKNGHSSSQQLRVTHVYVYGQRGWQAIASQQTLLPG